MEVNKLYENLIKAKDENVPKGIEFAWCDIYNNHVKWEDLVDAVALLLKMSAVDSIPKPPAILEESPSE